MDGWNTSYGDDSLSIVNTASGTTSVVVAKFWTLPEGMSADDQTVEVTLTRDGQKLTGDEYTKTITGNGMVKFENLPKYNENGQLYPNSTAPRRPAAIISRQSCYQRRLHHHLLQHRGR